MNVETRQCNHKNKKYVIAASFYLGTGFGDGNEIFFFAFLCVSARGFLGVKGIRNFLI